MHVLNVCPGPHDRALRGRGTRMVHPHGRGPRRRIVGPRHGGGGGGVPVRRLRHLAARGQIPVRAGHVPQSGGVHAGALEAAGLEPLVQVRVVHG